MSENEWIALGVISVLICISIAGYIWAHCKEQQCLKEGDELFAEARTLRLQALSIHKETNEHGI